MDKENRLRFVSVWLNVMTGGKEDWTLSAELGRDKVMSDARVLPFIVDWFFLIFTGQLEHCRESYMKALGVVNRSAWADGYASPARREFARIRMLALPALLTGGGGLLALVFGMWLHFALK